jgi:hypothetical protein
MEDTQETALTSFNIEVQMKVTRRSLLAAMPALPLISHDALGQCFGVGITVNGASGTPTVRAGTPIQIAIFNGPATPTDWVGISVAESPDDSVITQAYLNGSQTAPETGLRFANVTLMAPQQLSIYEARLYFRNEFAILARAPFLALPNF